MTGRAVVGVAWRVRLVACLVPRARRARFLEEWSADLQDPAAVDLGLWSVTFGMVLAAVSVRRLDRRSHRTNGPAGQRNGARLVSVGDGVAVGVLMVVTDVPCWVLLALLASVLLVRGVHLLADRRSIGPVGQLGTSR